MATKIQKGKSVLRPRARLIRTIGDELISSDVVALLELVKNSYDADANIIEIKFEGRVVEIEEGKKKKRVLLKEGAKITVLDDGTGMTLNTIKSAWMEPATIVKKNKVKTPLKGRRFTGEKGIGRFASAKLAKNLDIVTKVKNDNEVVAYFNWDAFAADKKYLDQVKCRWEVREPATIKDNGTILYLKNLNSDWDEEKLKGLRITLSRLINPLSPALDFLIALILPEELSDLTGDIEPPTSLSKPMYSIKGDINNQGIGTFIYESINISKSEKISINISNEIRPKREIKTGPFSFLIYVWDRETETLKELSKLIGSTVKNIKDDLNALSGISIYRDNFRVLPYGEPKNDWLRLDLRRVQNPTLRLSNNQLIGYISLSLSNNPEFKDQSNREGLIESQAFSDLQETIKIILSLLEERRYVERRIEENEPEKLSLFANFAVGKYLKVITQKHPDDKEIKEAVEKTEASINEGVKKIQQVLSQYRRLSTLGYLIDSVLHDGNHYLSLIEGEAVLLQRELKSDLFNLNDALNNTQKISKYREMFYNRLKLLEPFSGRKRGRPKDIILEKSIANVFALQETSIKRLNISYKLPISENVVHIDEGDLDTIILNLLLNSIHWLESVEKREIIVEVDKTDESLNILFSDSGPGVKEENYKAIFDPYFSTKSEGIGLGLTIIGEIITEYNGEFLLIDDGPLDGATFKIVFKRRL